jgi:hypothetical protein
MSDRRRVERPESTDRRSFPRPPLWLNLLLLVIAAATFAYAKHQRDVIAEKTALLFKPSPTNPAELVRVRQDLSDMDLTRAQLAQQLDGRLQLLQGLNAEQFYIAVDTSKKKFYFRFGKDIVREADAVVGAQRKVTSKDGRTWTFIPAKGAFTVSSKQTDYDWPVPDWVYAMNSQPAPSGRPAIANGLGKYVIALPNDYVIHSPPPPDSPLAGTPKPGSIMLPEADLEAIWPRIVAGQTRVYIF